MHRLRRKAKRLFPKLKQVFNITISGIHQVDEKKHALKPSAPVVTSHVADAVDAAIDSKRPPIKLSSIGSSVNAIRERREGHKAAVKLATETTEHESQQFSLEDLRRAWVQMCNNMPECDAANAERMKSMDVHITVFPEIMVTITNSILEKYMLKIKSNIEASLKRLLHNDDIKVLYHVAASIELANKGLTHREIMELLCNTNPAIARLYNFFNFEIL